MSSSRGWLNKSVYHRLECPIPIAKHIVQYVLMGEMFSYIVGMKKGELYNSMFSII